MTHVQRRNKQIVAPFFIFNLQYKDLRSLHIKMRHNLRVGQLFLIKYDNDDQVSDILQIVIINFVIINNRYIIDNY